MSRLQGDLPETAALVVGVGVVAELLFFGVCELPGRISQATVTPIIKNRIAKDVFIVCSRNNFLLGVSLQGLASRSGLATAGEERQLTQLTGN
jgi:hypothetical protein